MARYAKTQAELAKELGTTRQTVNELARDPSFPKKAARGYAVEPCRKFMELHGRGAFRKGSGGKSTNIEGVTLTEAKIRDTLEHAENERIKKERQLVEQAKELLQVVDAEDVRRLYAQTAATLAALHDAAYDAADRAMPESIPQDVRDRVLAVIKKIAIDAYAALQELNDRPTGDSTNAD